MLPTSFQSTLLPLVDLYKLYLDNYPSLLFCSSAKHPETTRVSSTYATILTVQAGQWQPSAPSFLPHFKNYQPPLITIDKNLVAVLSSF
jgi:hypothetical protein